MDNDQGLEFLKGRKRCTEANIYGVVVSKLTIAPRISRSRNQSRHKCPRPSSKVLHVHPSSATLLGLRIWTYHAMDAAACLIDAYS